MAVYNYLQPLTQVADLPEYQKPTWFRKRTGESTFFGDVFTTAVPALTTVAGTILGGPLGTAIGQAAGQGIVGAVNRSESNNARLQGARDAQNQIDNDLAPDMARAGVISNLAGLLNVNTGTAASPGTPTTAQMVNPEADVAGLGAGALDVTGMSGYQQQKNNLVNQFNQPKQVATGWQAKLGPIDPSMLPGMVQNAVVGFGKRGRLHPIFGSTYQTFAEGGKPVPNQKRSQVTAASSTSIERPMNPLQVQTNRIAAIQQQVADSQPQISSPTFVAPSIRQAFATAQTRKELADKTLSIADKAALTLPIPYVGETVGVLGAGVGTGIRGLKAIEDVHKGDYLSAANNVGNAAAEMIAPSLLGKLAKVYNKERLINAVTHQHQFSSTAAQQEADAGADWVRNWIKGRANASLGGLTPADAHYNQAIKRPVVAENSKTWEKMGNGSSTGETVEGVYYKSRDVATVSPNAVDPRSTAVHETSHQWQNAMKNNPGMRHGLEQIRQQTPASYINDEYLNYLSQPKEIHARLMQLRHELGYRPDELITKKQFLHDLANRSNQNPYWQFDPYGVWKNQVVNWLNKTPGIALPVSAGAVAGKAFQGTDKQPFAEGGKPGRPNYLRYLDTDKSTEDLLLVDKKTGKLHGAMRYGERIYDQKATDHIDRSVLDLKLNPSEDGFKALGKYVFGETLSHKDHQGIQTFADGGKPTPDDRTPEPSETIRKAQERMKQAGLYDGPINGLYTQATNQALQHWNSTARLIPDRTPLTSVESTDDYVHYLVNDEPWKYLKDGVVDDPIINIEKNSRKVGSSLLPDKPTPKYNWLSPGNIADAARTFIGYTQVNRDLPENPINPDYLKLVADSKVQSTQGLGSASRQLLNSQINDSRSLGIDTLRKATGSGGSAGAVIAGLGAVNDSTTNAALKLVAADEQANLANQQKYQHLLSGLIDQQQQRFGMGYNAALLNKQQGLNLAQQGLQGIQNRYDVWKLYDNPNSALAKYAALQNENTAADTQATKNNYLSIGKLLSNT